MNESRETIVIRAPNWVGDAVVATAILKPLRARRQDARIAVVAKRYVAPLFYHHPSIDEVIEFDGFSEGIRAISGDSGIILPNSFSSALLFALSAVKRRIGYRSEFRGFLLTEAVPLPLLREEHLVENYRRLALKYLGARCDDAFEPSLFLSADEKKSDPFRCLDIPPDRLPVILDPGSAYGAAKEWKAEKYAAVADYCTEKKHRPVVLLGSAGSRRLADDIARACRRQPYRLTGALTLRQAMHAISKCALYLSPDTGGMHIAAAMGVPQVAIFGSSSPRWTRPLNEKSRVVYLNLACSPCFKRTCPLGTLACLADISPEAVIGHLGELI